MFLSQPADGHKTVETFGTDHGLDRVRDHSRDTSEYRIPGEPIEMPSDTVMVLNNTPLPPAAIGAGERLRSPDR
jgi:hypothetical protein